MARPPWIFCSSPELAFVYDKRLVFMRIRLDRHEQQQWVWASPDTMSVIAHKLIYLFKAEYLWRPDGCYDIDYSTGLWAQYVRSKGFAVPEPDEEPFGRLVARIDALIDEADHPSNGWPASYGADVR